MPLERPNHYGHLLGKTHTGKLAEPVAFAPSTKERWDECRGGVFHEMTMKPGYTARGSVSYRGGYAELDRKLSPRFPTTAEAAQRRRQRQHYWGSVLILIAGLGVALGLSGLPYVRVIGYGFGFVLSLTGLAFLMAGRERKTL
jgi:hypothetical protein